MHHLLEVCLLAATLATGIPPWLVAQLSGEAATNSRLDLSAGNRSDGKGSGGLPQQLETGSSVELPATRDARSIPEADRGDPLRVTVTEDGSNPVSPATLADETKTSLSNRTDQKLSLKADARPRYGNVGKVILGARTAGVRAPILLTKQPGSRKANPLAAPTGSEVQTASRFAAGLEPAAVQSLGARALAIRPRRRGKWMPVSVGPYPGSRTTAFRGLR